MTPFIKKPFIKTPLIFTDLDGSLLDHDTYEWRAAEPLLRQLEKQAFPVIANTSKTHSELLALTQSIPLSPIHIIENGAGIFLPKADFVFQEDFVSFDEHYWLKSFSKPRQHFASLIHRLTTQDEALPMSSMNIKMIIEKTGLGYSEAILANDRLFTEPVIMTGDKKNKEQFIQKLQQSGANLLEGGRFIHVCDHCDKGLALDWLTAYLTQKNQTHYTTVAIGDGNNDIAMLDAADAALLIPSPSHPLPKTHKTENLFIADHAGPLGWQQGLTAILKQLNVLQE